MSDQPDFRHIKLEADIRTKNPTSDSHSDSDSDSFHSVNTHPEPTELDGTELGNPEPSPASVEEYGHEQHDTMEQSQAVEPEVPTPQASTAPAIQQSNIPMECPCRALHRYCHCLGTGYVRLCPDCAGVECDICGGPGVVPAFPASPGVDRRELLRQRGAPPGLNIAPEVPAPRQRPSLRDIVLGRWRNIRTNSEAQSAAGPSQHARNTRYYVRTPESLPLVLDGPRAGDPEFSLPPMYYHDCHPMSLWTPASIVPTQAEDRLSLSSTLVDPLGASLEDTAEHMDHQHHNAEPGLSHVRGQYVPFHMPGWDGQHALNSDGSSLDSFSDGGEERDFLADIDAEGPIPEEHRPTSTIRTRSRRETAREVRPTCGEVNANVRARMIWSSVYGHGTAGVGRG